MMLSGLPVEAIQIVTSKLGTISILNLWLTGDLKLRQLIQARGGVIELRLLDRSRGSTSRWPRIASDFLLFELVIDVPSFSLDSDLQMWDKLSRLSSLRSLDLCIPRLEHILREGINEAGNIDLNSAFPNLQSLRIRSWDDQHDTLEKIIFPENLKTYLRVGRVTSSSEPHFRDRLPFASIQHLHLPNPYLVKNLPNMSLFQTLETLIISTKDASDEFIHSLPISLTSLDFVDPYRVDHLEQLTHLTNLRHLSLTAPHVANKEKVNLSHLTSLTSLIIAPNSDIFSHGAPCLIMPMSLLHFKCFFRLQHRMVLPASLKSLATSSRQTDLRLYDFATLEKPIPAGLIPLHPELEIFPSVNDPRVDLLYDVVHPHLRLDALPVGLTKLQSDIDWPESLLVKQTEEIEIRKSLLSIALLRHVCQLPLEMWNCNDAMSISILDLLPRTLGSLTLKQVESSNVDLRLDFSSFTNLTHLRIHSRGDQSQIVALPKRLQSLSLSFPAPPVEKVHQMRFWNLLPKGLTTLHLTQYAPSSNFISNEIFQVLSTLTELHSIFLSCEPFCIQMSNEDMALLPPSLVSFVHTLPAGRLDSGCFKYLPRYLTRLSMRHLRVVSPDHAFQLPRGLRELNLASNLTGNPGIPTTCTMFDGCAVSSATTFPPVCPDTRIRQNSFLSHNNP
jgi:hypothetical protein